MTSADTTDLISAIASLWKLAAFIALPISAYLLRAPLSKLLPRVRRVRQGKTEIDLSYQEDSSIKRDYAEPDESKTQPREVMDSSIDESADADPQFRIFEAIIRNDIAAANAALLELQETEPDNRLDHEVFYYSLLCDIQKDEEALEKLEEIAQNDAYSEHRSKVFRTIAFFYNSIDEHRKAIINYQKAIEASKNEVEQASSIAGKANSLVSAGRDSEGKDLLLRALSELKDAEGLAVIYEGIAVIYENDGNYIARAAALEKVAEYRPTDKDATFNAAYAQSSAGLSFLALHNYRRNLKIDPKASLARNNYGVELSEIGLPIHSAREYRRAQRDGNTLAMANIAYLLINSGLAEDAETLLNEAKEKDQYHGNVDRALAKVRADQESEEAKFKDVEKWGSKYHLFTRSFALAFFAASDEEVSFRGVWISADGNAISIEQEGKTFSAEWGKKNHRKKITGSQTNRAANIDFFVEQRGLLLPSDDKPRYGSPKKALGLLTPDGKSAEIITVGASDPIHLIMKRR